MLLDETELLRLELLEVPRDRAEVFEQRSRAGVLVDEHPVGELLAAHRHQRVRAHVEPDEVTLVAQVHQLTVERVGPAVVGADETVAASRVRLHQRCAAMAAGVVERADLPVLATHDQDRRTGPVPEHEAAGVRQLVGMAGVEPGALPERLLLGLEEPWVVVAATGNRRELREPCGRRLAARLVLHSVEEAADEGFSCGCVHGRTPLICRKEYRSGPGQKKQA